MSRVSVTSEARTSSRVWSCATLQEGVDHVAAEAAALEKEERELEEQIKALPRLPKFSHGGRKLILIWNIEMEYRNQRRESQNVLLYAASIYPSNIDIFVSPKPIFA